MPENTQVRTISKTNVGEKIGITVSVLGAITMLFSFGFFIFQNLFSKPKEEAKVTTPTKTTINTDYTCSSNRDEVLVISPNNTRECYTLAKIASNKTSFGKILGDPNYIKVFPTRKLESGEAEFDKAMANFWLPAIKAWNWATPLTEGPITVNCPTGKNLEIRAPDGTTTCLGEQEFLNYPNLGSILIDSTYQKSFAGASAIYIPGGTVQSDLWAWLSTLWNILKGIFNGGGGGGTNCSVSMSCPNSVCSESAPPPCECAAPYCNSYGYAVCDCWGW